MKTIEMEEPDSGRAWLIAFAACIINMILSGLSRMIGILYVFVIEDYGTTREEATLPFTVRNGIRCLSGPLVGIIGQRFGIRTVTFWGGVVAALGAGLCSIAPNVTWLAVFWGGIHGCGFAFANTLFQVIVNQYFEKYRATASGIALSGACFGSLVFPVMLEEILYKYGLKGGFLILAGIIMHVLPPSILLTAPQWILYPKAYARMWELQYGEKAPEVPEEIPSEKLLSSAIKLERTTSMSNNPVETMQVMKSTSRQQSYEVEVFKASEDISSDKSSAKSVVCTLYRKKESPRMDRRNIGVIENGFSSSKDAQSIYSISGQMFQQKSSESEIPRDDNPDKGSSSTVDPKSIKESLKIIAKLYTNPVYVLISICMSTYIIIFIPILTVIVDYSVDKGIPASSGKYLINAMAIGDLAGRLCFGWVTDKKYMTIPSFMALVLFLEGVFIALFPFGMSLSTFMILLVLYGMTAGAILVLFPVLVLQYMDTNEQSVGIACVGFLSGIMSFALPPMIGHFRDVVGSYDGMFYLTGGVSVLSGGLWLFEPIVLKWYSKRSGFNAKPAESHMAQIVGSSQKGTVNARQMKLS